MAIFIREESESRSNSIRFKSIRFDSIRFVSFRYDPMIGDFRFHNYTNVFCRSRSEKERHKNEEMMEKKKSISGCFRIQNELEKKPNNNQTNQTNGEVKEL